MQGFLILETKQFTLKRLLNTNHLKLHSSKLKIKCLIFLYCAVFIQQKHEFIILHICNI